MLGLLRVANVGWTKLVDETTEHDITGQVNREVSGKMRPHHRHGEEVQASCLFAGYGMISQGRDGNGDET
jgi:hypothetical protein